MDIHGSINNYQRGELAAVARIYIDHKLNYNEVVGDNGLAAVGRELRRVISNAMQSRRCHYNFSDDDLFIVAQLINLMGEGYVMADN